MAGRGKTVFFREERKWSLDLEEEVWTKDPGFYAEITGIGGMLRCCYGTPTELSRDGHPYLVDDPSSEALP